MTTVRNQHEDRIPGRKASLYTLPGQVWKHETD